MGYRGKLAERDKARELRATVMTMNDIAVALGVSRSSVSLWTRDVAFEPHPRRPARRRGPNALQRRKQAEIEEMLEWGRQMLGSVGRRDLLLAGIALYAGEGTKRGGEVRFSNTDPRMVALFCVWLRTFFKIDETRLHAVLYLHIGLDLDAAVRHWSAVIGIPPEQFRKPYRAVPDKSIRHNKHEFGCATVKYGCSRTLRGITGLMDALLSSEADIPG